MRKLTKTEFARVTGGSMKNTRWSWVIENDSERLVYFLGWQHAYLSRERRYPMRTESTYNPSAHTSQGSAEWHHALDRCLSGEVTPRLAICKPKDINAEPKEIEFVGGFYFAGSVAVDTNGEVWFHVTARREIL